MPDTSASSSAGIFPRHTLVSSIQLHSAILHKVNFFPVENLESLAVLFSKPYPILISKDCKTFNQLLAQMV
jgi:hypothetical protein